MTKLLLADVLRPGPQFARSVNIERDARANDLKGYLPTGRALDVLRRFTAALNDASLTRAWSITGPYGSGKSAFALLLNCLVGPADERARNEALALVSSVDQALASELRTALDAATDGRGFLRAAVTAQREPIERTVVRAVATALGRFKGAGRRWAALVKEAERLLATPLLSARAVADLVEGAAAVAPVLLLVDEFGKNLEFFADRPTDADLFVLQEIVERSSGTSGSRVFVGTLQHLAFEEYVAGATLSQRREWAKVQGRFEDVPFADSPAEVLQLVARVFRRARGADPAVLAAIDRWAETQYKVVEQLGLSDRLPSPGFLAACYPLHPLALAVLPELCSRYGQRERTLFSFLARPEPHSVASFLEEQAVSPRHLPVVGIEQVFDYFLATSGTIVTTADGASRWVEIDSRIRETQGLSDEETRLMKIAGVLNLVSRGGTVRASREALAYAAADLDVGPILETLQARGLLVHRGFADEFRIWQGTDFDMHGAIEEARRHLASEPLARVFERALPLPPMVAARHSQDKGILRFFDRTYADGFGLGRTPSADADGVLLYVLDDTPSSQIFERLNDSRPTILVYATEVGLVAGAAKDAAAVADVLASDGSLAGDWVARRELHERSALATERFRQAFDATFALDADGIEVVLAGGSAIDRRRRRTWSALLSDVCDEVYHSAPTVRNEMIARRQLSSQAARARRDLLVAMIEQAGTDHLGIDGYGPERAMLDAVLVHSGMYRLTDNGWEFAPPKSESDYMPAWRVIETFFAAADRTPVAFDALWQALQSRPIGLPEGPIPVLVTAALLVHADDVAIYQDGTFQPLFGAELIERMVRTPERFAVKHFGTRGPRARVLACV
jgi:energy-coupling factor transporter ATP-binding protein EcfA2